MATAIYASHPARDSETTSSRWTQITGASVTRSSFVDSEMIERIICHADSQHRPSDRLGFATKPL